MTGAGWTAFGSKGLGDGQYFGPSGIALDASGRIYVADPENNRIERIDDMSGANWATFGDLGQGTNQLYLPNAVAVDSQGMVYVADTRNSRVAQFAWQ